MSAMAVYKKLERQGITLTLSSNGGISISGDPALVDDTMHEVDRCFGDLRAILEEFALPVQPVMEAYRVLHDDAQARKKVRRRKRIA